MILRNGRVIDPATGRDEIADIVLDDSTDVAERDPAPSGIDVTGCLVIPGLIDFHTHVAETVVDLGKAPEDGGVATGVTAVCDAGSCGYINFPAFARFNVPTSTAAVYALLHVSPFGEAVLPETGYDRFDEARFLDTVAEFRDIIRGVKLRFIGEILDLDRVDVMELAVRVARKADLPLIVHTGFDRPTTLTPSEVRRHQVRLLEMLQGGDVLTHAFTGKVGGFFPDGEPIPELPSALERGVLLDVAPGRGHIDFTVAQRAIELGFLPHLLGTDAVRRPDPEPHFYSVPVVMSKMLALGVPLDRVVSMASTAPAAVLGVAGDGPADISVLRIHRGDYAFHDGAAGNVIPGSIVLTPELVIRRGRLHTPAEVYRTHVPTAAMIAAAQRTPARGG